MPNRKNAILQLKKDTKRFERNKAVKSELKTVRKKFDKILQEGKKEEVVNMYKELTSSIDKTVKKGIIPKGRGSRLKSRYTLKVNALK
ncbi:MAG: 30S ribosomal protein S20 [uncultured bacterium]|nr:MAG: 30S ribosomal protein S20 [uncultured bacterium]